MAISISELQTLADRFDVVPQRSYSLPARAYTQPGYLDIEQEAIFYKSWQYVCHLEQLRQPGDYIAIDIQGQPIIALRDRAGVLRAFYNVCRHRGHELVKGEGNLKAIVCPYHAWCYSLDGKLLSARHSNTIENFDCDDFGLMPVQIEAFCTMIFINLNPEAKSLAIQSGELAHEIQQYAPDLENLTHAYRLTYRIKANWKSVVDNFLECYHCAVAHKDFVSLVDMHNYLVTTHGIYSSHIAPAGKTNNSAYSVAGASVQDHAVWWLWPNTCLLRYPGAPNWMVWRFIPIDTETTAETFDFFFEDSTPTPAQMEAIRYIDQVLQKEDIDIVESVQRGMKTPAYEQGRFVCSANGQGESEHAVHHFHSLYLEAIAQYLQSRQLKEQGKRVI
ncbi:MAG: ring-hydroxylating oxygenase subunit alpha [Anaerolineae bacterium]|nr:ring-hydroxylating oxygenase subunit alpha [Anaerolineae bacterium]